MLKRHLKQAPVFNDRKPRETPSAKIHLNDFLQKAGEFKSEIVKKCDDHKAKCTEEAVKRMEGMFTKDLQVLESITENDALFKLLERKHLLAVEKSRNYQYAIEKEQNDPLYNYSNGCDIEKLLMDNTTDDSPVPADATETPSENELEQKKRKRIDRPVRAAASTNLTQTLAEHSDKELEEEASSSDEYVHPYERLSKVDSKLAKMKPQEKKQWIKDKSEEWLNKISAVNSIYKNPNLQFLKFERARRSMIKYYDENILRKPILMKHIPFTEPLDEIEIIITLAFYSIQKPQTKLLEFEVLGSQKVNHIKKCFYCIIDGCHHNMHSGTSLYDMQSYFLFQEEKIVYYSSSNMPSTAWWESEGYDEWKRIDTDSLHWKDLSLQLYYPYCFVHRDNCQHVFMVTNIKYTETAALKNIKFPRMTFAYAPYRPTCALCQKFPSKKLVMHDKLVGMQVGYYCNRCFESVHAEPAEDDTTESFVSLDFPPEIPFIFSP